MNAKNAAELLAQPDVDGGLIGGATLKPAGFCADHQRGESGVIAAGLPIPDQREREVRRAAKPPRGWEAAKGGVTMSTPEKKGLL